MSGIVSESTKTRTVQEGNVIKTITERTVTTADGKTTTYREEKTQAAGGGSGGSCGGNMSSGFGMDRDAMMARFNEMGGGGGPMSLQGGGFPDMSSGRGSSNPSTQSNGSGSVSIKEFRDQALKAHNERRSRHGVPSLKLNNDLNKYAQDWADHLVKSGSFQHSNCKMGGDTLGENIANKWSSAGADYNGEEVTEQWYSEISKHNYSSENSMGTGHFTQVVWKDTTELGMGKAQSSDGKVIVVGSYRPAGNFIGNFTKNVFPPK